MIIIRRASAGKDQHFGRRPIGWARPLGSKETRSLVRAGRQTSIQVAWLGKSDHVSRAYYHRDHYTFSTNGAPAREPRASRNEATQIILASIPFRRQIGPQPSLSFSFIRDFCGQVLLSWQPRSAMKWQRERGARARARPLNEWQRD